MFIFPLLSVYSCGAAGPPPLPWPLPLLSVVVTAAITGVVAFGGFFAQHDADQRHSPCICAAMTLPSFQPTAAPVHAARFENEGHTAFAFTIMASVFDGSSMSLGIAQQHSFTVSVRFLHSPGSTPFLHLVPLLSQLH